MVLLNRRSHLGMPRHCLVVHAAPQRNGVAPSSQVILKCHGIAVWFMRLRKEMVLLHRRRSLMNATALPCGSCDCAKKWCCFIVAVPYECHGIAVWFMRLRKEVVLLHRCSHLGMPRHCRVVHAAPQRNDVASSSQVTQGMPRQSQYYSPSQTRSHL
ncbi:hypothetical protein Aduo_014738 [Ancylostoma duodenale]